MNQKEPICITGLWLRRIGENVEVLIERDDQWYRILRENIEGNFSEIVESAGMVTLGILDPILSDTGTEFVRSFKGYVDVSG